MKKAINILLLLVSACGFEPLYVQKKNASSWYFGGDFDASIATEMSQVKVLSVPNRFGQQIRNQLLDNLTPKGTPLKPKYRLEITLDDKEVVLQALRDDITATRERVGYKAYYKMYDNDSKELFKNDSIAYVSYDVLANPYSTTMAQKKAEENAAKIIADDITLRIGAYFHAQLTGEAK